MRLCAWLVISLGIWEKWQTALWVLLSIQNGLAFEIYIAVFNILESPGAIQGEATEGLYNPPDWCLVLDSHMILIY